MRLSLVSRSSPPRTSIRPRWRRHHPSEASSDVYAEVLHGFLKPFGVSSQTGERGSQALVQNSAELFVLRSRVCCRRAASTDKHKPAKQQEGDGDDPGASGGGTTNDCVSPIAIPQPDAGTTCCCTWPPRVAFGTSVEAVESARALRGKGGGGSSASGPDFPEETGRGRIHRFAPRNGADFKARRPSFEPWHNNSDIDQFTIEPGASQMPRWPKPPEIPRDRIHSRTRLKLAERAPERLPMLHKVG